MDFNFEIDAYEGDMLNEKFKDWLMHHTPINVIEYFLRSKKRFGTGNDTNP